MCGLSFLEVDPKRVLSLGSHIGKSESLMGDHGRLCVSTQYFCVRDIVLL